MLKPILLLAIVLVACKVMRPQAAKEKFKSVATRTCIADHLDNLDKFGLSEKEIKEWKQRFEIYGKEKFRKKFCPKPEIDEKLYLANKVHKDNSWHQPYIEKKPGYPVSKAGWLIAYGFANDCNMSTAAKVELQDIISRYLRLWLAELKDYAKIFTNKPLVDDFYYVESKVADGNISHEGDKKPHLNVVFHCNDKEHSQFSPTRFEIDMYYLPAKKSVKSLYFLPHRAKYAEDANGNGYSMLDLIRQLGQAFGLHVSYHDGQSLSVMKGARFYAWFDKTLKDKLVLGKDDKRGIQHLYQYFHQRTSATDCMHYDYEYVVSTPNIGGRGECVPKKPLIFDLQQAFYQQKYRENDSISFLYSLHLKWIINDSKTYDVDNLKINAPDEITGNTGLHYVVLYGSEVRYNSDWLSMLEDLTEITPCPSTTNVCIELNQQNNEGQTALHLATQLGFSKAARILALKAGVNKNLRDKAGKTALDYARDNNLKEIVELLD